jgi:hypothetical protein
MKPLPANSISGGFPRFDGGEVFVILHPDLTYQYRLDKATLSRVSPWFASVLQVPCPEASEALKVARTNADARFDLRYYPDEAMWRLNRTVS